MPMSHAFSHRRESHADDEAWSSGALLPGGKVDADAIVAAQQKARELAWRKRTMRSFDAFDLNCGMISTSGWISIW